jgi:hypothetical protein
MMWQPLIPAILVAIILAIGLSSMFSESHFREFHSTLAAAIGATTARKERRELGSYDRSHFVTGAGLGAAVTLSPHSEGGYTLHISLSQPGRMTTHAVATRFGLFILGMLQG